MLPAYKGRINRKTFIFGNLIGAGVLGFVALIYIVPLALIDIVINSLSGNDISGIFKVLYSLFLIPAVFYAFYFSVLFVKRLHDIGYPGMLILWSFIFLLAFARLTDISIFNLGALLILAGVTLLPGQKARNPFGQKPHNKFKLADVIVKF